MTLISHLGSHHLFFLLTLVSTCNVWFPPAHLICFAFGLLRFQSRH